MQKLPWKRRRQRGSRTTPTLTAFSRTTLTAFSRTTLTALMALVPLLASIPAARAVADPFIFTEVVPLGGGLVGYDVVVDFNDGESLSGFVEIDFTGPFNQIQAFGQDVDTDTLADIYDGLDGYDAASDSYFITSFWLNVLEISGGESMSAQYTFKAGNPGDFEIADLAYLVLPSGQGFSWVAKISRDGESFQVVPEPSIPLLQGLSLATLAALAALRPPARRDTLARCGNGSRTDRSWSSPGETASRSTARCASRCCETGGT